MKNNLPRNQQQAYHSNKQTSNITNPKTTWFGRNGGSSCCFDDVARYRWSWWLIMVTAWRNRAQQGLDMFKSRITMVEALEKTECKVNFQLGSYAWNGSQTMARSWDNQRLLERFGALVRKSILAQMQIERMEVFCVFSAASRVWKWQKISSYTSV